MTASSESRFFQSLASIMGLQTELAEVSDIDKVDRDPMEKLASMPVEEIMEDPNFLKGLEDRFAARAHEIDQAMADYIAQ